MFVFIYEGVGTRVKKESKIMKTRELGQLSYFLIGIGLVAVGGLISVLARKETRDLLRKRGRQSLDYLNRHRRTCAKLSRTRKKGERPTGPHRDSVKTDADAERQAYQEEKRDMPSG